MQQYSKVNYARERWTTIDSAVSQVHSSHPTHNIAVHQTGIVDCCCAVDGAFPRNSRRICPDLEVHNGITSVSIFSQRSLLTNLSWRKTRPSRRCQTKSKERLNQTVFQRRWSEQRPHKWLVPKLADVVDSVDDRPGSGTGESIPLGDRASGTLKHLEPMIPSCADMLQSNRAASDQFVAANSETANRFTVLLIEIRLHMGFSDKRWVDFYDE